MHQRRSNLGIKGARLKPRREPHNARKPLNRAAFREPRAKVDEAEAVELGSRLCVPRRLAGLSRPKNQPWEGPFRSMSRGRVRFALTRAN